MQLHFLANATFGQILRPGHPLQSNGSGCPNTHIHKRVYSVLSNHLFLVFGSNLAFVPKNKNQIHFSGKRQAAGFSNQSNMNTSSRCHYEGQKSLIMTLHKFLECYAHPNCSIPIRHSIIKSKSHSSIKGQMFGHFVCRTY